MSKELIPYVILSAHPDHKRPYILPQFGMILEDNLKEHLLEQLVDFVYDRIDIENLKNVDDIQYFWEHFYDEKYMDNSPWDATAIINGEWVSVGPTNEELFNKLLTYKNKENIYISSDTQDDSESTTESIINDYNEIECIED